jgi:hypothetical protein
MFHIPNTMVGKIFLSDCLHVDDLYFWIVHSLESKKWKEIVE